MLVPVALILSLYQTSHVCHIENNYHGIKIETDNNQILYNNILNNRLLDSGIQLSKDASGNEIHCNNIERNLGYGVVKEENLGVSKEGGGNVDATNNWWGCSEGPGGACCDTVSGTVTDDPWLPMKFEYCEACGGTPPCPPPKVPSLNHWGIVALISLFAGLLVWTVRRSRLAS